MKEFGRRIKELRKARKLTKEDFCEDETELSVRQLTRIESGLSLPTLAKVVFIAKRLGVTVGELADEEKVKLPNRYKELKFLLLRTQTYTEPKRLELRESYFEEIYSELYDKLPEEEQVIIDCVQAKSDVNFSQQTDFGKGLLEEYFSQVKIKEQYSANDLILISLYFMCIITSQFSDKFFEIGTYQQITATLLNQVDQIPLEELFLLNNLFIDIIEISLMLEQFDQVEFALDKANNIMYQTQDFQKMPIINLLEWKYSLRHLGDFQRAKNCYNKAIVFSQMTANTYLEEKLKQEWEKDNQLK